MTSLRYLACALLALSLTAPVDPAGSAPTTRTAVLDRFEGDRAVLVVEDADSPETLTVDPARLPSAGRHVDAVFAVSLAHGSLTSVEYDRRATRRRTRSARQRFAGLARTQSDRVPSTSTGSPTESATPTSDSGT
ncbi:DUF3006 family protein [Halomarina litorea]|uniref:DUF3006 family protein n=1 Tax=Halomarina litorea TaxID=2961595 RepID=UPI0020C4E976|nr:DUF3006 family protein [Halomarina sp. BCD28]